VFSSRCLVSTATTSVEILTRVSHQPGLNEITISDLTSLAEPDSVRVSGTTDSDDHPARINDLIIDLVNNSNWGLSNVIDDNSDAGDESDNDSDEPDSVQAARENKEQIADEIKQVKECRDSAQMEFYMLEQYSSHMSSGKGDPVNPTTMQQTLELYASQRKIHQAKIMSCAKELRVLEKKLVNAGKQLRKEQDKYASVNSKKAAAKLKRLAEKDERRRERRENKSERLYKVYRVRLTVELPGPSEMDKATDGQDSTFVLTYTTKSASWTPAYDLRLDTTDPSLSTLTYRAHLTNRTYETWTNAYITLSTSQASFGGLKECIPWMESWRVTLAKKTGYLKGENGLYSLAEQAKVLGYESPKFVRSPVPPPVQVIPTYDIYPSGPIVVQAPQPAYSPPVIPHSPAQNIYHYRSHSESRSRSRSPARIRPSRSRSSSSSSFAPRRSARRRRSYSPHARVHSPQRDRRSRNRSRSPPRSHRGHENTIVVAGNTIPHAAADTDTYGFTTTYELPTPRTITSSPQVRRHVIAEIGLSKLRFTHILIPKLKPAAYLKAKLTNTSSTHLLPGLAGLTLDGSFMGSLVFPRCAPDEEVTLELGVDQGVKVEYERPTVKHSTQGIIIGKEEVGVYKRSMKITNTKGASVDLVVLDQVPVPENDKLKVNIMVPKGLRNVDDIVKCVGVDGNPGTSKAKVKVTEEDPVSKERLEVIPETSSGRGSVRSSITAFSRRESMKKPSVADPPEPKALVSLSSPQLTSSGWGTANATLGRNGEVRWDLDLENGASVDLNLEWECRMPIGEGMYGLS
jgi:hypothetical protein